MKVEGAAKRVDMVRAMVDREIPSWAISVSLRSASTSWVLLGRTTDDVLHEDAHSLEEADCFVLALQGIPAELAASDQMRPDHPDWIGPSCSRQVLVIHDFWVWLSAVALSSFGFYAKGFQLLHEAPIGSLIPYR